MTIIPHNITTKVSAMSDRAPRYRTLKNANLIQVYISYAPRDVLFVLAYTDELSHLFYQIAHNER